MQITKNSVVTIQYTLKDDAGEVLDQSTPEEPLAYIHGLGHLIPGLENELDGKTSGDKLNTKIEPKDAYGERNDQMIQVVPKSEFENAESIQPGMQFQVESDEGPIFFTAVKVDENEITLDGNHPLAGVTLHFDVEITDVREATAEELDHGHVHGPGGQNH